MIFRAKDVSRETWEELGRGQVMAITAEDFQAETNVSRETCDRLRVYADLLIKWQKSINLVGRSTLDDLWSRHFLDSAQLYPRLPRNPQPLVDLGSGAGFPGLVLAIMGVPNVCLVESDGRKAAFLREVIRATGTDASVHLGRIEEFQPAEPARVITSRALASLDRLLGFSEPLLAPDGVCFFLKGQKVREELTESEKKWIIGADWGVSVTDPSGVILRIDRIERNHGISS